LQSEIPSVSTYVKSCAGYSVLEVAEDGGISISIARQMAAIFDSMASSGATRKKVTLNCGVWGIFPDNSLTPIKANLNIEIFDDICCLDLDSWIHFCFFLPGCF
jgi:hypothetical protein